MITAFGFAICLALVSGAACLFIPDAAGQAKQGTVERIKVHGKFLEGNLDGDSPDRDVSIYLPPSYKTEKTRRYPMVYMLHGFTDDDARWFGVVKHWINLPEVINKALTDGKTREMIVVMPNAFTRFKGSMYSNPRRRSDSRSSGEAERQCDTGHDSPVHSESEATESHRIGRRDKRHGNFRRGEGA
jgi:enterochelin esterase-like enzyme